MTISLNAWVRGLKQIINIHYLSKRLNFKFIIGAIRKIILESKNRNTPWLNTPAIHLLDNWIKPNDKILEFGSGQSTIWFATKTKNIISVEHNKDWYKQIKFKLNKIKVKYIFAKNKTEYLAIFNKIKNESIDICLVDGEYRRDCIIKVASKIKIGGLMIFDNAETYLPVTWKSNSFQDTWEQRGKPEKQKNIKIQKLLQKFRILVTSDVTQDTIFFVKNER